MIASNERQRRPEHLAPDDAKRRWTQDLDLSGWLDLVRQGRALRGASAVARDVIPVAAVGAFGALFLAADPGPDPLWLSALVVGVPLFPALVRHRRPLPAFATTALAAVVAFLVLGLTGGVLTIPVLAVLLCLVTVVEHAPDWAAGAAVTLAAVLIGATLLTPPSTGDRPVFLLSALGVAAVARGRNRRARRMVLASLRDRAEQAERTQRTMAQAAVADERRRIAREVHDIVSHNIAVMTTLADGATVALRNDRGLADACEAVQAIAGTGREAMQEMRALLGVLRDPDDPTDFGDSGRPPAPGLADLQALVDQVRTAGLPTVLQVHGKPVPLGGGTGLTVYRLVQEALSNSLRHACNATSASVSLHWADSHLSITVTDDGHPPTFPAPSGGLGLVGMRERVLAHGGTVTSGPMAAGGWGVRARLPLTAPHPEVAT